MEQAKREGKNAEKLGSWGHLSGINKCRGQEKKLLPCCRVWNVDVHVHSSSSPLPEHKSSWRFLRNAGFD